MENKELTMEIDHINMNTQEVISIDWRSKGIRLDVFARNSAQVFDIDGDRTIKSFFISANCNKLLNEEQKAFMRLVSGGGSSNSFTDRVAHLTEDAKQNNEYRRQYMEWERQKAYEYKRGKQEGKEEAKIEGA